MYLTISIFSSQTRIICKVLVITQTKSHIMNKKKDFGELIKQLVHKRAERDRKKELLKGLNSEVKKLEKEITNLENIIKRG